MQFVYLQQNPEILHSLILAFYWAWGFHHLPRFHSDCFQQKLATFLSYSILCVIVNSWKFLSLHNCGGRFLNVPQVAVYCEALRFVLCNSGPFSYIHFLGLMLRSSRTLGTVRGRDWFAHKLRTGKALSLSTLICRPEFFFLWR